MPKNRRSRGPLCPSCAKCFKDETTLLQHLNQPSGRCTSLQDDIVTLATHTHGLAQAFSGSTTNDSIDPALDEPIFHDNRMSEGAEEEALHRDFFPEAGQTYGDGPTFMDLFNSDHHASKRINNVYYPFRTRGDWEMGSWLLRSDLSMRAINDFLKLEKVRVRFCPHEYKANIL